MKQRHHRAFVPDGPLLRAISEFIVYAVLAGVLVLMIREGNP